MQVVGGDLGELLADLLEDPGPQVAGVHQHVVLVDERQLLARAGVGAAVGVAHDTLDAERGVQADLGRDLVLGAGAQRAAVADVRALGALADDDEVDARLAGQRGLHAGEELARAEVDVVVEGEAQLEQQPALQDTGRDARVADGAEQDRVVGLELLQHTVREGLPGAVVAAGAEVVLGRLHLDVRGEGGAEDLEAFGHHFLADAVTGDHCETKAARHVGDPTPVSRC